MDGPWAAQVTDVGFPARVSSQQPIIHTSAEVLLSATAPCSSSVAARRSATGRMVVPEAVCRHSWPITQCLTLLTGRRYLMKSRVFHEALQACRMPLRCKLGNLRDCCASGSATPATRRGGGPRISHASRAFFRLRVPISKHDRHGCPGFKAPNPRLLPACSMQT